MSGPHGIFSELWTRVKQRVNERETEAFFEGYSEAVNLTIRMLDDKESALWSQVSTGDPLTPDQQSRLLEIRSLREDLSRALVKRTTDAREDLM